MRVICTYCRKEMGFVEPYGSSPEFYIPAICYECSKRAIKRLLEEEKANIKRWNKED